MSATSEGLAFKSKAEPTIYLQVDFEKISIFTIKLNEASAKTLRDMMQNSPEGEPAFAFDLRKELFEKLNDVLDPR